MSKPSALDRLRKVAKKATPTTDKKNGIREVNIGPGVQKIVTRLCELAALGDVIDPQLERTKDTLKGELLDVYLTEMWDNKQHPDNFKVQAYQGSEPDSKANFIVKFRDDGLRKKFAGEVPEDQTIEDLVIQGLRSVAGLSETNAKAFFNNEIVIREKYDFAQPIPEIMALAETEPLRVALTKLLDFASARPKGKDTHVKVSALTDEEEGMLWKLSQDVMLKPDLEMRIWNYVENKDQLRKLMMYIGVTLQVSNFEFAIGASVDERNHRLELAVQSYLLGGDEG